MARQFKVAIAATDGSPEDPSYTFAADLDTGMYRSGADSVALTAGGANNLIVDTAGVRAYNSFRTRFGDIVGEEDVVHEHGTSRSTSMMDLEVLSWM